MPIIRKHAAWLIAVLMFSTASHAGIITVEPAVPVVELGDQVQVDLIIDPNAGTLIGGFDLLVNFDDTVLAVAGLAFGNSISDPFDPFFLFQSAIDLGGGLISFGEITNLFDFTGFQDGVSDFLLASILFDTIGTGMSDINVSNVLLSDDLGFILESAVVNGSVTVQETSTPVSAPGSLWLLLGGLAVLLARRSAKKIQA